MSRHVGGKVRHAQDWFARHLPGIALAGLVAMSAQFVAEHSQAPSMMMALLFGMVISFVYETDPKVRPGVEFTAKPLLKMGIVLLGARISVDVMIALGWQTACMVTFALIATLGLGLGVGRLLGLDRSLSMLTAGAVSICGVSAALAISAVLPKTEESDKHLLITIIGVTTLSTIAMILYPVLLQQFGIGDTLAGQILGATIHDVAQVVGAGFSMSETTGDTATLVKLLRVSLLAPTVILLALLMRQRKTASNARKHNQPIIPLFVLGFFGFVALNSLGGIPDGLKEPLTMASRAALLAAIAGVGLKTNLRQITEIGYAPILLMLIETVFIAVVATLGFLSISILDV